MKKNKLNPTPLSVVMLGATGAVGSQALQTLLHLSHIKQLTLLGRRSVEGISNTAVHQHNIDIFEPSSYSEFLANHEKAICTLGVGEPSKMSKEDFIKIDKLAVLDFAFACKKAGVKHFELLSSVGISSSSSSFFLRVKGELVDELKGLNFERLSIFQPSMILTSTNRYGFAQGLTLAVFPYLKPLLMGGLRQYRGIRVEKLGSAMAMNLFIKKTGEETLFWDDFQALSQLEL